MCGGREGNGSLYCKNVLVTKHVTATRHTVLKDTQDSVKVFKTYVTETLSLSILKLVNSIQEINFSSDFTCIFLKFWSHFHYYCITHTIFRHNTVSKTSFCVWLSVLTADVTSSSKHSIMQEGLVEHCVGTPCQPRPHHGVYSDTAKGCTQGKQNILLATVYEASA